MEETSKDTNLLPDNKNSSTVYIIGAVIILLFVGVGVYFMNKNSESRISIEETKEQGTQPVRSSPPSLKGQKLSDTKFANSAVLIYPGEISESAKAVMSGWELKTNTNPDGTVTASLIPVGSEATEGDIAHTFTLKTGDKLYFVDLNPNDDGTTNDQNTRDDMGIVVDNTGVIQ